MPVVTCPKCPTQLRVPDSATGNVKCPKCQHIFPLGARPAPAPAFEVVDDSPAKPAAKPAVAAARPAAAAAARPAPPPPPPPAAPAKKSKPDDDVDVEFEEDEAPRKKKRRDDDYDDEDDRDRPRGRRRRDDDDEDDDRDRPRRKRRGRRDDDDYDEDDDWRPAKKGSGFGHAATGTLLMAIGLWLYTAMFGILALFTLIGMTTTVPEGLMSVAGICGVACTILTIIGTSFCIAGPRKARGMAIATVSVAAAHVVLVIICYDKITGGRGGLGMGFIMGGVDWVFLGTSIWILDIILPALIYAPRGASLGGEFVLFILAGACELTRMILVCLTLRALATSAKDYGAAEQGGRAMVITCVVCGAAALGALLLVVIIDAAKMGRSALYLGGVGVTAICVGYALMGLAAAMAAMSTKGSLARMARRRG